MKNEIYFYKKDKNIESRNESNKNVQKFYAENYKKYQRIRLKLPKSMDTHPRVIDRKTNFC